MFLLSLCLYGLQPSQAAPQETMPQGIEDVETIRVRCSTGEYEITTVEKLKRGEVCNNKNFLSFCSKRYAKDLSTTQKQQLETTVSMLKKYVNSKDCEDTFKKLKKLDYLSLQGSDIVDISPLLGLASLRHLDLSNNKITDLTPLQKLKELTVLHLNNNLLENAPILDMPKLRRIYLNNNPLTSLEWLKGMPNLQHLVFNHTEDTTHNITNLDGIQHLSKLRHLEISGVGLVDVSPISALKLLRVIKLNDNQITAVPTLKAKHLHTLEMHTNLIPSVDFLKYSPKLTHLNLNTNKIKDLSPISTLLHIHTALFANNEINDLSPVTRSLDLMKVDFRDNRISDITALQSLHQLTIEGSEFLHNPIDGHRAVDNCPRQAISPSLRQYCS